MISKHFHLGIANLQMPSTFPLQVCVPGLFTSSVSEDKPFLVYIVNKGLYKILSPVFIVSTIQMCDAIQRNKSALFRNLSRLSFE